MKLQIFQLGIDYTFFFFERSRRVIGTIPRQIFKLAMSNKIEDFLRHEICSHLVLGFKNLYSVVTGFYITRSILNCEFSNFPRYYLHKNFDLYVKDSPLWADIFPTSFEVGGQSLSRSLFLRYRQIFFSEKRSLRTTILLPPRGIAPSGFRPLWKIPHCCLP